MMMLIALRVCASMPGVFHGPPAQGMHSSARRTCVPGRACVGAIATRTNPPRPTFPIALSSSFHSTITGCRAHSKRQHIPLYYKPSPSVYFGKMKCSLILAASTLFGSTFAAVHKMPLKKVPLSEQLVCSVHPTG